ncbi:DUF166 domain-containing protein [Methanobacterium petrolearium]|uniref:DUF166 domain-containing protein n=1 Tax=Methanobacterium petrolearium TaxID=710190 RepID=UPI001AEB5ED9|nr:hypothetical protein [Methanobacterium petrolearium]BDZ71610.1 hypothetical protein GCM10025861_21270 [Methanobacterium petrolearium]
MKISIVTDGSYGERAHATIKEEFNCDYIMMDAPTSTFMDEIDLPSETLAQLENADIIITYTLHPDLTLDLVDALHDKVEWIIVGAWRGDGFKNQLEKYGNVTCPENMCDLSENGNPIFDEFVSKFGQPIVRVNCQGDKVVDVKVLRCSPCGSTRFVAEEMVGEPTETLPVRAGLRIQHYPCRAPKMRLFADDECKKELAANFHKKAFENALKKDNNAD